MVELKMDEKVIDDVAFAYFVFGQTLDMERDNINVQQSKYLRKRFLAEYLIEHSSGAELVGMDNYREIFLDDLKELLTAL